MLKRHLVIAIALIMLLCGSPAARAGFFVSSKSVTTSVPIDDDKDKKAKKRERRMIPANERERPVRVANNDRQSGGNKSGWQGIAALVCGLTGFLFIPAIILGIIGWQKGRKNRGMAIAGFVLGALYVLYLILVIAAFAIIF